jgi:hypothetical protein
LAANEDQDNQWIADLMLKHIEDSDKRPFLLIRDGKRVE